MLLGVASSLFFFFESLRSSSLRVLAVMNFDYVVDIVFKNGLHFLY